MTTHSIMVARCGITGFESQAKQYAQAPLSLDELLMDTPTASLIYQMQGDHLNKQGIFDHDLVVVDKALAVKHGDIVVVELNGEVLCKQINTAYKVLYSSELNDRPITIQEFDEFIIKGVVTRSVRCHRPLKPVSLFVD